MLRSVSLRSVSHRSMLFGACAILLLGLQLLLTACRDSPSAPLTPPVIPPVTPPDQPSGRVLGLVEVTLSGIGTNDMHASARAVVPATALHSSLTSSANGVHPDLATVTNGDGSIQLQSLSTGSFTQGTRGNGGVRYLFATFRVRNATAGGTAYPDARTNLTFLPVATSGTIAGTPFSQLVRFDSSAAASAIASAIKPTGAVHSTDGSVVSSEPDVLQLFTETDIAGTFSPPAGVTTVFPYGFVTRRADGAPGTRTLAANPAASQFDGIVTFAFRVPLQATPQADPFQINFMAVAADDPTTRITQSLEEQDAAATAAFEAEVTALGATEVTRLPTATISPKVTRCIAQVRTAGSPGAATDSLVDYNQFGSYADLVMLLPGEQLDACATSHKSGTPTDQTAGASFSVDVVAVDSRGFVVRSLTNQVALTTSDVNALVQLPAAANLVAGRATLSGVKLITTGTPTDGLPTLTATDKTSGPATGALSVPLDPTTADPAAVTVTADRTRQNRAGTAAVTATVRDIFGNLAWNGTVSFTSTLGTVSAATNNGDGTYSGTLTMPSTASFQQADTAKVTATVGGSLGAGSAGVYLFAWKQVSASAGSNNTVDHTCGLATDGTVYCWGYNAQGELGDGTTTDRTTPTRVSAVAGFTQVSAGSMHTCGVVTNGTVYCWGRNTNGQVSNDASFADGTPPTAITSVSGFSQVSAGTDHTCGVLTNGSAYCWGDNTNGQLGTGGAAVTQVAPTQVATVSTFARIGVGVQSTCGVTTDGTAYCWGLNGNGELGNGTTTNSTVPTVVSGSLSFTQVSVRADFACGIVTGGAAYCWGYNQNGELGNGDMPNSSAVPVPVSNVTGFAQLETGALQTCAVTTGGAVYCWGGNLGGEIGDNTSTNRDVPTAVVNGTGFAQVSAGTFYSCGVTTDGTAYCWGQNNIGQLGDGTVNQSLVPVRVQFP